MLCFGNNESERDRKKDKKEDGESA